MPRIARAVAIGFPHHITQRGNYRQTVFDSDADYSQYLEWLKVYSVKYSLKIWAYCLMSNYVHFIVVPMAQDSMARTLNMLHMRYSQYKNTKQKEAGHLWQGRFFSCVLDERHLYAWVRYVDSVGKPLNETNPYIYTGNNPVNRVDPSGNSWIGDVKDDVFSLSGNWSYYLGAAAGAAGYVAGDLTCGPLCGWAAGGAFGWAGGKVGALFDPKSSGQLNYNEPKVSYPAIKQGKCGS